MFQFQNGSIKRRIKSEIETLKKRFNSKMVRLKVSEIEVNKGQVPFQFQNGSIKSLI